MVYTWRQSDVLFTSWEFCRISSVCQLGFWIEPQHEGDRETEAGESDEPRLGWSLAALDGRDLHCEGRALHRRRRRAGVAVGGGRLRGCSARASRPRRSGRSRRACARRPRRGGRSRHARTAGRAGMSETGEAGVAAPAPRLRRGHRERRARTRPRMGCWPTGPRRAERGAGAAEDPRGSDSSARRGRAEESLYGSTTEPNRTDPTRTHALPPVT